MSILAIYQLAQTNLVDDIAAALSTTGLDPAMLVVEITESAVVRDVGQGQIQKLHVLGIQIGIDDFGMGYSSLARLRRVPAHILKIDKLFVENLVTSQGDRAILRAIYDLATAMGHAGRRRRGRDHGPARGADQDRPYQSAGLLLVVRRTRGRPVVTLRFGKA